MTLKKLLEGIVILDFTQNLAGSLGQRIMADMGAEVIKVERYPWGDQIREAGSGYQVEGKTSNVYHLNLNAGKKSICFDFHNPEAIKLIKELVPHVDAVTESFSPGQMEKYGLDYDSLQAIKPNLVYCSFSAFGQNGPYRNWVAYNPLIEALSGLAHTTGDPEGHPQLPGFGLGDTNASIHNAVALLAALWYRDRTGIGQHIDTAMLDSLTIMGAVNWFTIATDGKADAKRYGRHRDTIVPYGLYQCKGEYVALEITTSGEESMWGRFCKAIERPDMIRDSRFDTLVHRAQNREECIRIIQEWFDKQPNAIQAAEYLQRHRVACAPVLSPRQIMQSPHASERHLSVRVYHPALGEEASILATPYKFSKTPVKTEEGAPLLGQHNEYILRKYLSYSDQQLQVLYEKGIIYQDSRT